jgi:hypothetical protein
VKGSNSLTALVEKGLAGMCSYPCHALGRALLRLGQLDEARRLSDLGSKLDRSQLGVTADIRHLLGDIATHPDRFNPESGEPYYREALTLAEPRGMRPLIAHCHLGLGKLSRRTTSRAT